VWLRAPRTWVIAVTTTHRADNWPRRLYRSLVGVHLGQ
jgi:hypothetical protein